MEFLCQFFLTLLNRETYKGRMKLYLLLLLTSFAAADLNQVPVDEIPSYYAFTEWRPVDGYTTDALDLNKVPQISLNCSSANLYPTHADQSTKQYHQFNYGSYDINKLKAEDPTCLLPSKYKNAAGKYYCQRSDILYSTVISDTYRDLCGNQYRAFWRVTYLKQNDNMGTLFSRGRTMYQNPGSDFPGDVVLGGTYITNVKDFLFLSPLFTGDDNLIKQAFKKNQSSRIRYNPDTLLFEEVRP